MGRKKKNTKESVLDQISMDDTIAMIAPDDSIQKFEPLESKKIKKTILNSHDSTNEIPEEVRKNNSKLINAVMNIDNEVDDSVIEVEELALNKFPVINKVSLSYNEEVVVGRLTSFDKEVIDAVATLAPYTDIMSATSIFQIIAGKINAKVSKEQREKVNESMEKCRQYIVKIDLTSAYLKHSPQEEGNITSLKYSGSLISFESVDKTSKNGSNYFYHILNIPPLFRIAESMGKISIFPLELLNTPVNKSEQAIIVQAYLIKEIDSIKKKEIKNIIFWKSIFEIAEIDTVNQRYAMTRVKTYILKILEYWKEKEFIKDYMEEKDGKEKCLKIIC